MRIACAALLVTFLATACATTGDHAPPLSGGLTGLHIAAYRGNVSAIRDLLTAGMDPDVRTDPGYLQATPLLDAISGGQFAAAKVLIEAGADVNARDELGFTPLMLAATAGRPDLVSLLLKNGARREIQYADGSTAADLAEMEGHHELAAQLRSGVVSPSETGE